MRKSLPLSALTVTGREKQPNKNIFMKITDIKKALLVSKTAKKIQKDLSQIAKTIGASEHVTGNITIEYTNIPVDVWDEALKNVTGFDRHEHWVLIRSKLQVMLVLN